LRAELGPNLSAISAGEQLAHSTVRTYPDRTEAAGLDAAAADGLSETALEAPLYPPSSIGQCRALPGWAEVDQALRRHKHVTRKLLWMEYKTMQYRPPTFAGACLLGLTLKRRGGAGFLCALVWHLIFVLRQIRRRWSRK
jgi:pimeloyl-ACP methyl ester carboxylesterase